MLGTLIANTNSSKSITLMRIAEIVLFIWIGIATNAALAW
jgi:uncharacterized membrane protein YkgB